MPKKTSKKSSSSKEEKKEVIIDSSNNKSAQLLLIVIVVLLILGGLIIWYQKYSYEKAKDQALEQVQTSLQSRIIDLQKNIDQAMNEKNQEGQKTEDLQQELETLKLSLLEAKLRIALRDSWGVEELVSDPLQPGVYFFYSYDTSSDYINKYDASKFVDDVDGFVFDVADISNIYQEPTERGFEFRMAGVVGTNILLVKTRTDDSPGPCYQLLLDERLEAIDYSAEEVVRNEEYTLPSSMRNEAESEAQQCLEDIANDAVNAIESEE